MESKMVFFVAHLKNCWIFDFGRLFFFLLGSKPKPLKPQPRWPWCLGRKHLSKHIPVLWLVRSFHPMVASGYINKSPPQKKNTEIHDSPSHSKDHGPWHSKPVYKSILYPMTHPWDWHILNLPRPSKRIRFQPPGLFLVGFSGCKFHTRLLSGSHSPLTTSFVTHITTVDVWNPAFTSWGW